MNKLAMVVLVVAGAFGADFTYAQGGQVPGGTIDTRPGCTHCGGTRGNRPESPELKTRALKPKPVKECEENGCANRPDAPKTRALKPKKGKEECNTDYC